MSEADFEAIRKKIKLINAAGLAMILFGILFKGIFFFFGLGAFYYTRKLRKGNPELKEETVIKTAKELYKDG